MNELYISETLTLVDRQHEFDSVTTYIFKPESPVTFEAGQYGHVRLLNLPETLHRVRELSFASSPQDSEIWFGIDGRSGSDYQLAFQSLKRGDTIELFKIKGHMTWPSPASDVVMIAGGVGVTPFRSMLRDAKQRDLKVTTRLIQVSSGAFLYGNELKELSSEYENIDRGLLENALLRTAAEYPDAHYYLAGSAGFVQSVLDQLEKTGITNIESDVFKGLIDD